MCKHVYMYNKLNIIFQPYVIDLLDNIKIQKKNSIKLTIGSLCVNYIPIVWVEEVSGLFLLQKNYIKVVHIFDGI